MNSIYTANYVFATFVDRLWQALLAGPTKSNSDAL